MKDATTREICLNLCSQTQYCTAFSFNYRLNVCYLHQEKGCEPVLKGDDHQDYTLYITERAGCGKCCYQVGYITMFLMRSSILIRYRRELHK